MYTKIAEMFQILFPQKVSSLSIDVLYDARHSTNVIVLPKLFHRNCQKLNSHD